MAEAKPKKPPKAKAKPKAAPKKPDKTAAPKKPPAAKKSKSKSKPKARPKKPAAYDSPAALAAYDAETARLVTESRHAVETAETEYKDAKEVAADAKREFEAVRKKHFALLKDREEYRGRAPKPVQQTIPFDNPNPPEPQPGGNGKPKKGAARKAGQATAAQPPVGHPSNPPGSTTWYPDTVWQQYPMDRLSAFGLKPSIVEKLREGTIKGKDPFPILTVGDLNKFTEPIPGTTYTRKLTDIDGIGRQAAEQIENAMSAFWSDWPTLAEPFAIELGHTRPLSEPEEPADADAEGKSTPAGRARVDRGSRNGDGAAEPDEPGTLPFTREAEPATA